eukprot:PhM_4_TR1964/c0_g1_i1/m.96260
MFLLRHLGRGCCTNGNQKLQQQQQHLFPTSSFPLLVVYHHQCHFYASYGHGGNRRTGPIAHQHKVPLLPKQKEAKEQPTTVRRPHSNQQHQQRAFHRQRADVSSSSRSPVDLHPCVRQLGKCPNDGMRYKCPHRNLPAEICVEYLCNGRCTRPMCPWYHGDVASFSNTTALERAATAAATTTTVSSNSVSSSNSDSNGSKDDDDVFALRVMSVVAARAIGGRQETVESIAASVAATTTKGVADDDVCRRVTAVFEDHPALITYDTGKVLWTGARQHSLVQGGGNNNSNNNNNSVFRSITNVYVAAIDAAKDWLGVARLLRSLPTSKCRLPLPVPCQRRIVHLFTSSSQRFEYLREFLELTERAQIKMAPSDWAKALPNNNSTDMEQHDATHSSDDTKKVVLTKLRAMPRFLLCSHVLEVHARGTPKDVRIPSRVVAAYLETAIPAFRAAKAMRVVQMLISAGRISFDERVVLALMNVLAVSGQRATALELWRKSRRSHRSIDIALHAIRLCSSVALVEEVASHCREMKLLHISSPPETQRRLLSALITKLSDLAEAGGGDGAATLAATLYIAPDVCATALEASVVLSVISLCSGGRVGDVLLKEVQTRAVTMAATPSEAVEMRELIQAIVGVSNR